MSCEYQVVLVSVVGSLRLSVHLSADNYSRNNHKFSKFVILSSSTTVDPLLQILVERDAFPEEPHGLLHANRV